MANKGWWLLGSLGLGLGGAFYLLTRPKKAKASTITLNLITGANALTYPGKTMALPDALTNIQSVTSIVWGKDDAGNWIYYLLQWGVGSLTSLVNGKSYVVVVTENCSWNIIPP